MSKLLLSLFLLLAVVFVRGDEGKNASTSEDGTAADEDEKSVHVLTKDNFDTFLKENPIVLVEFYAPWCGHCKRLAPEYAKAAKKLKEKGGIPLAKVDATAEADVAKRFDIKGYPTIKLFRKGEPEEYEGGRTSDTIISWIERMTGAAFDIVADIGEAKKRATEEAVAFIGHFKSKESESFNMFESVADSNRLLGKFLAAFGKDAKDEVTVYRQSEEPVTHSVSDKDALTTFVKNEHFPLFGAITGENFSSYFALNKEMVWFVGLEDVIKEASDVMRQVAKQFREELSFVSLDAEKYGGHAENALGVSEFPSLVYQSKKGRYVYPTQDFKSLKAIVDFFKDVKDGKIPKSLKSEAVPESQDSAVKVVVGTTFEEIVLDDKKDVLLEVYAPWCGHCKKLDPIYTEFAEKVASVTHVTVAKMDGTANECPVDDFDWTSFPTIFFVKAGEKKPLRYDGARTVEGFTEYVKKHSTKPVDVPDVEPKEGEGKDEL